MSNILFVSKEHYLSFRQAWAAAVNSPRAKRTIKYHKFPARTIGNITIEESISAEVKPGWLTAAHHVLFNILCDRPPYIGFIPVHSRQQLIHGSKYINHGYCKAIEDLAWIIRKAKDSLDTSPPKYNHTPKWREQTKSWTQDFLKPFNGTITPEMLVEIELPTVKPIISTWGRGEAIAKTILSGKRYSMAELEEAYKNIKRVETRRQVGKTTIVEYEYTFDISTK